MAVIGAMNPYIDALASLRSQLGFLPSIQRAPQVRAMAPTTGGGTDLDSLTRYAAQAGFTGNDIPTIVSILGAESGYNPRAHNTNAGTGDNSYGLAQINMLGKMGPERLKQFGLQSADQLFDPQTNLRAAYSVYRNAKSFKPWTTYQKGLNQKYYADAVSAAKRAGYLR